MALFNVSVMAYLHLPESVRLAIVQAAVAQERTASALEALVAALHEAATEVPVELHEAVKDLGPVTEAVAEAQDEPPPQAP